MLLCNIFLISDQNLTNMRTFVFSRAFTARAQISTCTQIKYQVDAHERRAVY